MKNLNVNLALHSIELAKLEQRHESKLYRIIQHDIPVLGFECEYDHLNGYEYYRFLGVGNLIIDDNIKIVFDNDKLRSNVTHYITIEQLESAYYDSIENTLFKRVNRWLTSKLKF